jgi:hypothetical protein
VSQKETGNTSHFHCIHLLFLFLNNCKKTTLKTNSMEKKRKKTKPPAKKKAPVKKTTDEKPPARKASAKKTPAKKPKSEFKKVTRKRKPIEPPPDDLPLSDTWLYFAEVEQMFKVKPRTINRWCEKGILVKHDWLGTIRFNKAYIDWMIEYGSRKYSWMIAIMLSGYGY